MPQKVPFCQQPGAKDLEVGLGLRGSYDEAGIRGYLDEKGGLSRNGRIVARKQLSHIFERQI